MTPTEMNEKSGEQVYACLRMLPDLPAALSTTAFIEAALQLGPFDGYKVFHLDAWAIVQRVRVLAGEDGVKWYLRAVLAQGVYRLTNLAAYRDLPPRLAAQAALQMERILAHPVAALAWLSLDSDLFQKEFGLVTLRLYGVGAQLADFRCGIGRSIVFSEGWRRSPRRLLALLLAGGFKPYLQLHTHTFTVAAFNETGWAECYRCCVELYALHPAVLGVFATSWYYDPALENISPRLNYLRKSPLAFGAKLLFIESKRSAVDNSLLTSATRRQLYTDGVYTPKNYMLIWPKKQHLAWARRSFNDVLPKQIKV